MDRTGAGHGQHATDDGALRAGEADYGPVGLTLPPGLTYDRWEAIGRTLWAMEWARLWWLGDGLL